jgi:hypothetical protein
MKRIDRILSSRIAVLLLALISDLAMVVLDLVELRITQFLTIHHLVLSSAERVVYGQ